MDDIDEKILAILRDTGRPMNIKEIVQLLDSTYHLRLLRQKVYARAESLNRYRFIEKKMNKNKIEYEVIE